MSLSTDDDVAVAAGTSVDFVRRVVSAGILQPADDGRFAPDAPAIVRTVRVLQDAGFEPELVGWAVTEGHLALEFLDQFSVRQGGRSDRTYGEIVESRGERGRTLGAIYAAFGVPEPAATTHIPRDEESLVCGFLDIWTALSPAADAPVRGARIAGESTRRIVEAFLDLWDEVARADWESEAGVRVSAPGGDLSAQMGAMLPSLLAWLTRRHAETSVHARIIRSFENELERLGRVPARPRHQPAIAFVDLAGYTRLTEEAGDELAVRSAVRLQELSATMAAKHGGRLVKLLGDGVVFRFPEPTAAVSAVAELLPQLRADGLPAGHAGIAAGPVIDRDGDVYGRTVNLAARLSANAGPDEALVTAAVVESMASPQFEFVPAGEAELRGFSTPIATWLLNRAAGER